MNEPLFNIPSEVYQTLSETERYLLHYIHQHLEDISTLSIVTLSERANVSTATIVRLMKKIGYNGYTSFKYRLKQEKKMTDASDQLKNIDEDIKLAIRKNEEEVLKRSSCKVLGKLKNA
ncbi:MurR/RpiR family transcriptional regulator, partial [Bacillus pumilus]|uniref:MurR/RpiR family transcriptional regulator n=1 Tax=Bacillus pumilus TaxID=1408 RepID=UPI0034DD889C|nr:MurR/RpiR family transcriptional regulator [Bacillus pumilus]